MTDFMKTDGELVPHDDWNRDRIELIKRTVFPDATKDELDMFIHACKRTGLDPLTRQIYAMKAKGKVNIQSSIDGFRIIAQRSGEYEGQDGPYWCGEDGKWVDVWIKKEYPVAAKVGVMRKGFREPLYSVAVWDSYAQKGYDGKVGFMWNKMPDLMLAKCAESLALRKAFPNDLSGIYSAEEMAQVHEASAHDHTARATAAAQIKNLSEPEIVMEDLQAMATSIANKKKARTGGPYEFVIPAGPHTGKRLGDMSTPELAAYKTKIDSAITASGISPRKDTADTLAAIKHVMEIEHA